MAKYSMLMLAVIQIFLTGCATNNADPKYYTLDMRPSGTANIQKNIEIDRLKPVEQLIRQEILIQKSHTEVEYYAADRWAASIDVLIMEKLKSEFGEPREANPTLILDGVIYEFGQAELDNKVNARVKIELNIRKQDASRYDTPLLTRTYIEEIPAAPATPKAIATALSRALEHIAVRIATDVNQL